jgi:hypothetical protein
MNQAKGTNLIFNLKFQIPSLLQSVLNFSISDFAFLRKNTLLICWEKLFNFLNSRGHPGVRGPQVKNRCFKGFRTWTSLTFHTWYLRRLLHQTSGSETSGHPKIYIILDGIRKLLWKLTFTYGQHSLKCNPLPSAAKNGHHLFTIPMHNAFCTVLTIACYGKAPRTQCKSLNTQTG